MARTGDAAARGWALRPWGTVRAVVVLGAATFAAALWLSPSGSADGRVFWIAIGIGAGVAGVASALRVRPLPLMALLGPSADHGADRAQTAEVADTAALLVRRIVGDLIVLIAVATAGTLLLAVVRGAGDGWSADLLRSLVATPVASAVVFIALLIVTVLTVVAVAGVARMRGSGAAPTAVARWIIGAVLCAAVALVGMLVLGLTDSTSAATEGTAAIVAFLVGPVVLASPWQVLLLWIVRVGLVGLAVSLIGAIVARSRSSR